MNEKKYKDEPICRIRSSILDDIRQLWFPAEFRIAAPIWKTDTPEMIDSDSQAALIAPPEEQQDAHSDSLASNRLVAEFATCLWYLKTKHFKRGWDSIEIGGDDPRIRRALSRINKSIETLKESGVDVHDPTNKRYPPGGEGLMRPIQFLPTAGLTFEIVSETVSPIIYRDERLIQRGEVFVAVPKEESAPEVASTDPTTEPGKDISKSD